MFRQRSQWYARRSDSTWQSEGLSFLKNTKIKNKFPISQGRRELQVVVYILKVVGILISMILSSTTAWRY